MAGYPIEVSSWSQTEIVGKPPAQLAAGPAQYQIEVNAETSNSLAFLMRPRIELLYPDVASVGDILTIYGNKFGNATSSGQPAEGSWVEVATLRTQVIAWGPERIQVFVPESAELGNRFVTVTISNAKSNEVPLDIVRDKKTAANRNPNLFCQENYGEMLTALRALSFEMDGSIPIMNAFIGGSLEQDQALFASAIDEAFHGDVPVLGNTLAIVEKLALHADAVLEGGCYKWIPVASPSAVSNATQTAVVVTDLVVAGKVCSTKALGNVPTRQCGYYPQGLPLYLANSPLSSLLTGPGPLEALESIAINGTDFIKLRLYGEWDRPEAVLFSAFAHGLLASLDLLVGIQTGTEATAEFAEMQALPRGVKRLRAYGKVVANDPNYLSVDPAQASHLATVADHLATTTLRLSQLTQELEGDWDSQNDDFLRWVDTNSNGVVDEGDKLDLNLQQEPLTVHGIPVGRLLHVLTHWKYEGVESLVSAYEQPELSAHVPRRLNRDRITDANKFFARVSTALKSVHDPKMDPYVTSLELGNILYGHGLLQNSPKGYLKVNVRKLFGLLEKQGLRPFLPQVINVAGSTILAVENEVKADTGIDVVNVDMAEGDTRHFAVDAKPMPIDCAVPGIGAARSKEQSYYFLFADPSFNGSVEIDGSKFDDPCSSGSSMRPASNYLLNKWLAGAGGPFPIALVTAISLAENHGLNSLRAMMIGAEAGFTNTQHALESKFGVRE